MASTAPPAEYNFIPGPLLHIISQHTPACISPPVCLPACLDFNMAVSPNPSSHTHHTNAHALQTHLCQIQLREQRNSSRQPKIRSSHALMPTLSLSLRLSLARSRARARALALSLARAPSLHSHRIRSSSALMPRLHSVYPYQILSGRPAAPLGDRHSFLPSFSTVHHLACVKCLTHVCSIRQRRGFGGAAATTAALSRTGVSACLTYCVRKAGTAP